MTRTFVLGFYWCSVTIGNVLAYVQFSYEDSGHISNKKYFKTAMDCIRQIEKYSNKKGWRIA